MRLMLQLQIVALVRPFCVFAEVSHALVVFGWESSRMYGYYSEAILVVWR